MKHHITPLVPFAFNVQILPTLMIVTTLALTGCDSNSSSEITTSNNASMLTVSSNSVTEGNVDTTTVVATFSATDDDTLTYHLSGDNSDYFVIGAQQIVLSAAGVAAINNMSLNLNSLSVTLEVSDATNTISHNLVISINKPDETYVILFEDSFESGDLAKWSVINYVGGSNEWVTEADNGNTFAVGNCYASSGTCNTWIISTALDVTSFSEVNLNFKNAWSYGTGSEQIAVKISTDHSENGDPDSASWTDVSVKVNWSSGDFEFVESGNIDLSEFAGQEIYVAFHYAYTVTDASKWEIDAVRIDGMSSERFSLSAEIIYARADLYNTREIYFEGSAKNGATESYSYAWDFGDGESSTEQNPSHAFDTTGSYEVQLIVTDNESNSVTTTEHLDIELQGEYEVANNVSDIRIATFNAGFDSKTTAGEQLTAMDGGDYVQAQKVAEIIQRTMPDILLLNEIDGNDQGATVTLFHQQYLSVAQTSALQSEALALSAYNVYFSDCNTGVTVEELDVDFNHNGTDNEADDRYGYGLYAGQYCMAILSKYDIDSANIRTFQHFLWQDMPDAYAPMDGDNDWYSDDEWNIFRLSSKTHIDLPLTINGETIHILASHPTPPVFDGDEDRNGLRNFDEIRLWADYIDPNSRYLYDDADNSALTLAADTRFIIVGDQNASLVEGDAYTNDFGLTAIEQLLNSPYINPNLSEHSLTQQIPLSIGGVANDADNLYASTHTASWQQRADYVLPSSFGFEIKQSGVFWPEYSDDLYYLVEAVNGVASSDHRLVWVDLNVLTK